MFALQCNRVQQFISECIALRLHKDEDIIKLRDDFIKDQDEVNIAVIVKRQPTINFDFHFRATLEKRQGMS